MFDTTLHVVKPFTIPSEWERIWSIDIGFTNPTVIQNWAKDNDGRLYLYREFYMSGKTMDEHAKIVLDYITDNKGKWVEPMPTKIIMDHDGQGRPIFERVIGMSSTPAQKKVSEGIGLVQDRLKLAGDGKPRLYVFDNALVQKDQTLIDRKLPTTTTDEFSRYIWDAKKDQPVKEFDHGMDAMRYAVAQCDMGASFRMEWA
jgi:phage terminase large subunit